MDAEVLVVGAGVVGASLAYGIAKRGKSVLVLDGGNRDLRAARANFGLVWAQGKGADFPAYSALSQESCGLWPSFVDELEQVAETKVDYAHPGGLVFCLGEEELENRSSLTRRMCDQRINTSTQMIDRAQLEKMMPKVELGAEVLGASYSPVDGHANPLQLLAGLHRAIMHLGGDIVFRSSVLRIRALERGFAVETADKTYCAPIVIVAAGLGTPMLTEQLGLTIPLKSNRGQLLVTERFAPILPYPASGLRQTSEGTIMIGATQEKPTDRGVTTASAMQLAARATRIIPALASARLVRQWSGFRILPPDGGPIYTQSSDYPGLFAAVCHSGVTLAACHAERVGPAMVEGLLDCEFQTFSNGRFDVQKCA